MQSNFIDFTNYTDWSLKYAEVHQTPPVAKLSTTLNYGQFISTTIKPKNYINF